MAFSAGQSWTYRAPQGFEASTLVIGAIVTFDGGRAVVCASVFGAPRKTPDGKLEIVNIPFLPMTEAAFAASVVELQGSAEPAPSFAGKLQEWGEDPRGLTTFTVPFDGFLDRLIALQMAEIVEKSAA